MPALSCAVCPACMVLWKPMLSVLGVTLAFSEAQHEALLFASLTLALAIAARDLWRSGLQTPFWLTVAGAGLMLASHALGDLPALEWAGLLAMVASVPARMVLRARAMAPVGVR